METVVIRDRATGSSATILPGQGFNCFSFQAMVKGAPLEVLWADPDFASGTTRPTRSGIPIMVPFVNRIGGTSVPYGGQTYEVTDAQMNGDNIIHGFCVNRPWRVVEQSESSVTGEFWASVDAPALKAQWPADFRVRATYALTGNSLAATLEVENPDSKPLPFGIGTHPYFRLPLGGSSADDCVITVPGNGVWELVNDLPTGRTSAVEPRVDLRAGMPYRDFTVNDILTDLDAPDGQVVATIHDPGSGVTLTQSWDPAFRECVIFSPAHREAACIEPMTNISDPFRLGDMGIETGMRTLQPGERFVGRVTISVTG